MAVSRALSFSQEISIFQVEVDGESLKVIEVVNKLRPNNTMFGHIIEEIMTFKRSMFLCSFKHVKREGNKLTYALTRRVVLAVDTNMWLEDLPPYFDGVFQYDLPQ